MISQSLGLGRAEAQEQRRKREAGVELKRQSEERTRRKSEAEVELYRQRVVLKPQTEALKQSRKSEAEAELKRQSEERRRRRERGERIAQLAATLSADELRARIAAQLALVTDIYSRLKSAEKSEAGKEWTRVPFLKIKTEGIAENSKRHELIEALGERLKRDAEVEPKRLSEERRRYERARLDAIDDKTRQGMAACRDLVEFTGSCVYCEAAITRGVNAHLDHIIPVAKGGVNSVDNLVWACDQCNLLKRDKSFHRFCKLGEFDPDPIVARLHALGKFI